MTSLIGGSFNTLSFSLRNMNLKIIIIIITILIILNLILYIKYNKYHFI